MCFGFTAHEEVDLQKRLLERERVGRALKSEEAGTNAIAARGLSHQLRESEALNRRLEVEPRQSYESLRLLCMIHILAEMRTPGGGQALKIFEAFFGF